MDDPPYTPKDGGILREGYHAELDELRKLAKDGKDWIARYQAEEITRSGIASLKVGFTDVMGYYIEVTNANETRVPPEYIHERTLKNAKRYSTPRLKEYEEKVVTAQERSQALEFELFLGVRDKVAAQTARLLQTADLLALLDFLGVAGGTRREPQLRPPGDRRRAGAARQRGAAPGARPNSRRRARSCRTTSASTRPRASSGSSPGRT